MGHIQPADGSIDLPGLHEYKFTLHHINMLIDSISDSENISDSFEYEIIVSRLLCLQHTRAIPRKIRERKLLEWETGLIPEGMLGYFQSHLPYKNSSYLNGLMALSKL